MIGSWKLYKTEKNAKTWLQECIFSQIDAENLIYSHIIAAAASESEASEQGSNPNLYMWVKISILPLVRCIMVPVGFYHNAVWSVALKCTCVVAVWSFFHCFDFREDRASFHAGGEVSTVFWRVFQDYIDISTIFTCVIYILYSIDHACVYVC